ncbi:MAG: EAL domain-containing protein [Clostridiales bacterium]|jgi:diguanylate cyclase (GGDEF)-like protein|nr:EAL domain-containing protein [Clostridiales bacterium]
MIRYFLFAVLIISLTALTYCAYKARTNDKPIAKPVWLLLMSAIPAVLGSALVIISREQFTSEIGHYLYYIGMNAILAYLFNFALEYCHIADYKKSYVMVMFAAMGANAVQILLNPFFHNVFETKRIVIGGADYYTRVPHLGHYVHLAVIYLFAAAVLLVFMRKIMTSARIYIERYILILCSIIISGIWESVYFIANTPLDSSMVSFAITGVLIFYFSLYYKPVFLLSDMLQRIASELAEYLYFFDEAGECIWANEKGIDFLGLKEDELYRVCDEIEKRFPQMSGRDEDWCGISSEGEGDNKRYYQLESHINEDSNYRDLVIGRFLSIRDTTDEQRKLETERYNARHDKLTGLYNKEYLFKRIEEELRDNPGVTYQVAYVDVNEFKLVNDIFGREFGDYTIQKIAKWISSRMQEHCIYGRLGGDTFCVCEPVDQFNPTRINDDISDFVVNKGDKEHHILIQIGVYEISPEDTDVSIMIDRARMALANIKRTYSHIAYYTDEIKDRIVWEQQISAELDRAIAERQIRPYLQPIVNQEGKPVGAEALARWIHPKKGFMSPADFIPVFERNGRIIDVDRHIWRCSAEILSEWSTTHPDLFISVNISPIDFYYMDIYEEIHGLVEEFGLDPVKLRLEITEQVMMSNLEEKLAVIDKLKKDGHLIEMDDFGSGYSSFNMLKDMPADLIKIDMVFLNNAENNKKARIILERLIGMIESLGMISLTEGVETDSQFAGLARMGCKLFQGYHFAKPLPVDEFEEYCSSIA